MKMPARLGFWLGGSLLFVSVVVEAAGPPDDPQGPMPGGAASVKAMMGEVSWATNDSRFRPARVGMTLPEGSRVRTGPGAAVDLALTGNAGTLRVTEQSVVALETLRFDPASGADEVRVTLHNGELVGIGNHVPKPSSYQIKIGAGIVGSAASQFRIEARGYLVVLDGIMIYAHKTEKGEITSTILKGPPGSYYAPGTGVHPAPEALNQEVLRQTTTGLTGGKRHWFWGGRNSDVNRSSQKAGAPPSRVPPSLNHGDRPLREF
jgi:hypothetical protein